MSSKLNNSWDIKYVYFIQLRYELDGIIFINYYLMIDKLHFPIFYDIHALICVIVVSLNTNGVLTLAMWVR